MSYTIYRVISVGMPRDHHAIFLEDNEDLSGRIYQVIGSIQYGMSFETKFAKQPETSATFESKTPVGTVTAANKSRVEEVCRNVPAPKKQFQGPKRLYPNESIRRCQEWTAEAIDALKVAQVLQ